MIRHICFTVELPPYESTCCSKRRSPSVNIGSIVSTAIVRLLHVLRRWESSNGLTLEMNVYSPSDSQHWFKNLYLSTDHIDSDRDGTKWRPENLHHDLRHGWAHGKRVKAPPKSALERLFRRIILVFKEALPEVEAVTELIIRRQLRRCISPIGLGKLLMSFTALSCICYEPWAPYEADEREFRDRGT